MELKIISNEENHFLKRKEIKFSVEQDGSTVSRAEITKEICKKLNLSPDATIVVRIDQGFGSKESAGIAHSYQSKELLGKSEPKHILARSGKKAEKPADEKPEEEKPAGEKPAEEKENAEAKKEEEPSKPNGEEGK